MTILVSPARSEHPEFSDVRLVLQIDKAYFEGELDGEGIRFEVDPPVTRPTWRHNGDKRFFLYLTWIRPDGSTVRRIKLFAEDLPSEVETVHLPGLGKDGTPSCARTRPLPER